MEEEATSLSSPSSPSLRPSVANLARLQGTAAAAAAEDGEGKPQSLAVFVPDPKPFMPDPKPFIPPIPNVDLNLVVRRSKNLLLPSSNDDPSSGATNHIVLDTSNDDPPAGHIPYGLTLRSGSNGTKRRPEVKEDRVPHIRRVNPKREEFMRRRFGEDVKDLPDEQGMEEFENMKVENFSAALLSGYGWAQGQVIGRNKKLPDTKLFEPERKDGPEGIGYCASIRNPEERRSLAYWKKNTYMGKEKIMRVISPGQHKSTQGKVSKSSVNSPLGPDLLEIGKELKSKHDMAVESGSVEERNSFKKLVIGDMDGKRTDTRTKSTCREENNSNLSQENSMIDGREKVRKVQCLASHIRVRIMSKDFMGGKLYLKEGEVIDVVSPTTCDIAIDGCRELVQAVDQELLEIALPQKGGSVLVLLGKHKGVFGSLVDWNTVDDTGLVKVADSHELIKVIRDEIAEYVGDLSYLGY